MSRYFFLMGTQGRSNRRKLIMMDLINKKDFSEDYFDHPEKNPNIYKYKSFLKARHGDSGSSLFNEDDEIVGILTRMSSEDPTEGWNGFAPVVANMDFINEVIRIDPKVKIRGINQE